MKQQDESTDLQTLQGELGDRAKELLGQAADFAREKPHMAVGVAFGLGWVLGNGLPPRVVMGAARMGWRSMLGGALAGGGLAGILQNLVPEGLLQGVLQGVGGQEQPGGRASQQHARREDAGASAMRTTGSMGASSYGTSAGAGVTHSGGTGSANTGSGATGAASSRRSGSEGVPRPKGSSSIKD